MMCLHPFIKYDKDKATRFQMLPCGKCIPCKINRTMEWCIRLEYEMLENKHSCFLTLTYDDEHLPKDNNLHKKDLQNFIKRFRESIPNYVKYYAVGEYGEEQKIYYSKSPKGEQTGILPHGRPHYHLIVFGVDENNCEELREILADCWKNCARDMFIEEKYKCVGTVTPDSIKYVTDYCQKKGTDPHEEILFGEHYETPFSLQSQGLGLSGFLKENPEVYQDGTIFYNGRKYPIPRYFRKKLDLPPTFKELENDPYKEFALKNGLVKYEDVEQFEKMPPGHKYNPYYELIRDKYPEHLEEVEKMLRARNNLRGDKKI